LFFFAVNIPSFSPGIESILTLWLPYEGIEIRSVLEKESENEVLGKFSDAKFRFDPIVRR